MSCGITDQELWSGLDRNAAGVVEHLEECSDCRSRAAKLQASMQAVAATSKVVQPAVPARIGGYEIRRRLGEGGMGIVYEAEQQSPRRLVAIKVVRADQTDDQYRIRLFQREAHTLARLKHPAIAAVYEAGRTDDGQDFFAMELVRGVPLNEYVRDQQTPRRQRLELFAKICDAINYAHQRGVIHRDLKPSNILIDPEGNPKILDFGLARITDAEAAITTLLTDAGRMMGTLPYMSPEEARGNPDEIDVRGDVYSLGVILYELIACQLPYTVKRAALHEAVRVICEEPPKKPSAVDRSLRGDLETIVLKALEKEPPRRYQSAALLSDDIGRFLGDQPILARRGNGLYQLRKFLVRHRLVVMFALVSVLLVSGARLWVEGLEETRQAAILLAQELSKLREAIIEYDYAVLLDETGKRDNAEPKYRNAVATFQRLGETDRAGPAFLRLGLLLMARAEPSEQELDDADVFLNEALNAFHDSQLPWYRERRKGLNALKRLYGPDLLDAPEALSEINTELAVLDAEEAAAAGSESGGGEGRPGKPSPPLRPSA